MEVKIARLEEKMDNMESSLKRIEAGVHQLTTQYVTKEEMVFRDREIKDLKDNQTWLWRTTITSLILSPVGSIVVAVIIYSTMKGGN